MDASDYQQEQEKCRTWLAEEMRLEAVPDAVWGYVNEPYGLVYCAIIYNDVGSWQELVQGARERLRKSLREVGGIVPPGREKGEGARAAPYEIAVEPSDEARRRAEAFAEVAVNMAHAHPDVRKFRQLYLGGQLLSEEEARGWLDKQGGPRLRDVLGQRAGPRKKKLLKLASKLSNTYRWREGDAAWFILTGHAPPPSGPIEAKAHISSASKRDGTPPTLVPGSSPPRYIDGVPRPRDYHPNTALITVSADVWVGAVEVAQAFRDAQRQVLGGDPKPLTGGDRTLEVVKFVARRMREYPGEPWKESLHAWNQTYPKWQYNDFRTLRQAFERFAYREYHLPNWQGREKTPYEA